MKEYGYAGAFIVGLLGNATVILPAPSLAFTTALGMSLNPILVGLAAGMGEALGELTGYLAGVGGKTVVESQDRYEWVQSFTDRYGGAFFLFLAAIPNPVFDIAGIVAGVMRYPILKFLLAVWAGKTLKAILFAGAGRHLLR
jgi:membrane protein YqaA with SNARE-associated domain